MPHFKRMDAHTLRAMREARASGNEQRAYEAATTYHYDRAHGHSGV